MLLEVRHTKAARRDLSEVWSYIALQDADAADRQLRRIAEVIARLRGVPGMGRPRPELAPDLRSFVIGRYLLFFDVDGDAGILRVVRVLASARDIKAGMFEGD